MTSGWLLRRSIQLHLEDRASRSLVNPPRLSKIYLQTQPTFFLSSKTSSSSSYISPTTSIYLLQSLLGEKSLALFVLILLRQVCFDTNLGCFALLLCQEAHPDSAKTLRRFCEDSAIRKKTPRGRFVALLHLKKKVSICLRFCQPISHHGWRQ